MREGDDSLEKMTQSKFAATVARYKNSDFFFFFCGM